MALFTTRQEIGRISQFVTSSSETWQDSLKLVKKLEELENKYNEQFKVVFDAIRQLITLPVKEKRKIGF